MVMHTMQIILDCIKFFQVVQVVALLLKLEWTFTRTIKMEDEHAGLTSKRRLKVMIYGRHEYVM